METAENLFDKWKLRWSAGLVEGNIFHLLSNDEKFGGELVKLSQKHIDGNVKVPTIYAILKRSSEAGLIKIQYKQSKNGVTRGTQRKYYTLTDKGKEYQQFLTSHMIKSVSSLFEIKQNIMEE